MKKLFSNLKNKLGFKNSKEEQENSYNIKTQKELDFYKNRHNIHELPEIYHYWSNKYLLPIFKKFEFCNPDDFFVTHCKKYCLNQKEQKVFKILSIGSGNGDLEVKIASELSSIGIKIFSIQCLDINTNMLNRALEFAKESGVEKHIELIEGDFNKWKPAKKHQYDVIIANQSLHHVIELEHLFDSIDQGLKKKGIFLTSDMIGRNGHMRWNEALDELQPFWNELDEKYKYNQMLKRQETSYINFDCSEAGFEGIRAQDILKLLVERFNFELFIPYANIVTVFIDRPFGHNFDINNPSDLDFIDRVHAVDSKLILSGKLKPTQMIAVMAKKDTSKYTNLIDPILTPDYCVRHT